jgi:hypothetical protein
LNSRDLDEVEAQSIAAGVALKRIFKKHKIKHAISFHRSIRAADRFREQQDALNRLRIIGPKTTNLHVSSKKTAGERTDLLREFVRHKRTLMTNARCLTEGVDVPAIDCVMFADPKQSRIGIVQAAGRALRRYRGKECGHIVVPLIVPTKMDFEEFAETTAFRQVAQTITALSTQDERIADEFRAIERGRVSSGKIVEIDGDIPVGMKMKLGEFAEAISTRVWDSVGRANWRNFKDARTFARSLGLTSVTEWQDYYKSHKKPADIPSAPDRTYADAGWSSWGDWLGTDTIASHLRQYRSFKKARNFVHGLGLKSSAEWRVYCASGKRPADIPSAPNQAYAKTGWAGMGDFLGTRRRRGSGWRRFNEARAFVRGLSLKSQMDWSHYCASGRKPADIPSSPEYVYAKTGWAGLGDFLGTGEVASHLRQYRSFEKARAFARSLGLKSNAGWRNYCKSGKKPADIPAQPDTSLVYAESGWSSWGDWLGTRRRRGSGWRPFNETRAFVRSLSLKSTVGWNEYCKSGKKPADIPASPSSVYASDGWVGWGDWLGTGRGRPRWTTIIQGGPCFRSTPRPYIQ